MHKLQGQTAIVTGGQRGLGTAILHEFAKEGANCVVNYPGPQEAEAANEAVAELAKLGVAAIAIAADVTKPGEMECRLHAFGEPVAPESSLRLAAESRM